MENKKRVLSICDVRDEEIVKKKLMEMGFISDEHCIISKEIATAREAIVSGVNEIIVFRRNTGTMTAQVIYNNCRSFIERDPKPTLNFIEL